MSKVSRIDQPVAVQGAPNKRWAQFRQIPSRTTLIMVLGLVVLQLAHIFGRGTPWLLDPRWASSQYLFSLILYGPLLAGITAHQGRKAAEVRWLLRSTPLKAAIIWLRSPLILGLGVFLAGWVAVIAASVSMGAPWNLTLLTARNLGSGIFGVVAFAAFGFALGTIWKHKLVPAVAVAATFAGQLWAWTGSSPALVWFGGGSAGVSGGELDSVATIMRVTFSLMIIILCVLVARKFLGGKGMSWLLWLSGAGGLAMVLLAPGIEPFKAHPITWECAGEQPQVCVPAQFGRFLPELVSWTDSSDVVQTLMASSDRVGSTLSTDELLLADVQKYGVNHRNTLGRLSISTTDLFYPNCLGLQGPDDGFMDDELQLDAFSKVSMWVEYMTVGPEQFLETSGITDITEFGVPSAAPGSPESHRFLQENLALMPSCQR